MLKHQLSQIVEEGSSTSGETTSRFKPKITFEEYAAEQMSKKEEGSSEDSSISCEELNKPTPIPCTGNIYSQLLPVLAANIGSLSSGLALGYPAVLLPQLQPDELNLYPVFNSTQFFNETYVDYSTTRHIPFTVTSEEGSWIAGIFGIGAIFGGLLSAFLGNRYGPKKSLMLLSFPDILGWLLVASSQNQAMMLAGRFFAGVAAAGYTPTIQIYAGEISQYQHRGWLCCLTVPVTAVGVLTMYVVGSWLPWHLAAATCAPAPLLMSICLMFYWDSPYWYTHSGMDTRAQDALEQFRGSETDISQEMLIILHYIKDEVQNYWFLEGIGKIFSTKKYLKPFVILNSLFVLMLCSGKFAMDFYAVDIFQFFGNGLNEYLSTVIVAFINLLGSILLVPLVKSCSRKLLLSMSALLMCISLLLLGLCMHSHFHNSMPLLLDCAWLPMFCSLAYLLAAPMGLCSLPFLFLVEFYPSEMRSLMAGITASFVNLVLFILVKAFPLLEGSLGDYGLFWLFGASCGGCIIFTLSYIPETKEKHLTAVENKFARLRKVTPASPWITPVPSPSINSVRKLHFKTHLFTQ